MKLSSDETRAVAFVLGLVGLAAVARVASRPEVAQVPAAAEADLLALERSSADELAEERTRARPLRPNERIDVNGAPADELDRLPGVGPGLAARIVAERERGGAFDSAADLRSVPGIGPALLRKLAGQLEFGPAPALGRRAAPPAEPGFAQHAARGSGAREGAEGGASPEAAGAVVLELNQATAAQLESLPGIGPALAGRIVAAREKAGGFRSIDDLEKVRGIGPATLARLRPFLRE